MEHPGKKHETRWVPVGLPQNKAIGGHQKQEIHIKVGSGEKHRKTQVLLTGPSSKTDLRTNSGQSVCHSTRLVACPQAALCTTSSGRVRCGFSVSSPFYLSLSGHRRIWRSEGGKAVDPRTGMDWRSCMCFCLTSNCMKGPKKPLLRSLKHCQALRPRFVSSMLWLRRKLLLKSASHHSCSFGERCRTSLDTPAFCWLKFWDGDSSFVTRPEP